MAGLVPTAWQQLAEVGGCPSRPSQQQLLFHPRPYGVWVSLSRGSPYPGIEPQPLLLLQPRFPESSPVQARVGGGRGPHCTADASLPWGMGTPDLGDLWGQEVQGGKQTPTISNIIPPPMPTHLRVNRLEANVQKWKYLYYFSLSYSFQECEPNLPQTPEAPGDLPASALRVVPQPGWPHSSCPSESSVGPPTGFLKGVTLELFL